MLNGEFSDLAKLLRQLFDKCADIERAMKNADVECKPAPVYQDGGQNELLNSGLSWIVDAANRLLDAFRASKLRQEELDGKQKELDARASEVSAELKRLLGTSNDLNNKFIRRRTACVGNGKILYVFWGIGRGIRYPLFRDGAKVAKLLTEERRKVYERHMEQLKYFCESDKANSGKMVSRKLFEMVFPILYEILFSARYTEGHDRRSERFAGTPED